METGLALIGLAILLLVWKIEGVIKLLKCKESNSDKSNKNGNIKNNNERF